jgi:uncharacterized membrane protein (DUF373 family)
VELPGPLRAERVIVRRQLIDTNSLSTVTGNDRTRLLGSEGAPVTLVVAWAALARRRDGACVKVTSWAAVSSATELRHKDGSMEEKTIGDRVQQENPEQVRVALRKQGRRQWAVMTLYERFEQVVALVLSALIGVIIIVALAQLIRLVVVLLITESLNPLQHETFQLVFGMIMTLLIALEFKHSSITVALRRDSIIQVKTVILIAVIALSRKFVILDVETSPAKIAALAFALLTLGLVYWLMRERDECAVRRAQQDEADEDE